MAKKNASLGRTYVKFVIVAGAENNCRYSDYQETEGIKHWTRAETYRKGKLNEKFEIKRIAFFDEVRDEWFARP